MNPSVNSYCVSDDSGLTDLVKGQALGKGALDLLFMICSVLDITTLNSQQESSTHVHAVTLKE